MLLPFRLCSFHARSFSNVNTSLLPHGVGNRLGFAGHVTVFGANGLLGISVVSQLAKAGYQINIAHRCHDMKLKHLRVGGDLGQMLFHEISLKDLDSIRRAVECSDFVVNCIGRHYNNRNFTIEDVHVTGSRDIARVCRQQGVKRLVHVSMLGACEAPQPVVFQRGSEVLRTKWHGERAVFEEFPDAIVLRPAVMFGLIDYFVSVYGKKMNRTLFPHHLWVHRQGKETYKRPIFLSDVARAIVNALSMKDVTGRIYDAYGMDCYRLDRLLHGIFLNCRLSILHDHFQYDRYITGENPSKPHTLSLNIIDSRFSLYNLFLYCFGEPWTKYSVSKFHSPMENIELAAVSEQPSTDTTDHVTQLGVPHLTSLESRLYGILAPLHREEMVEYVCMYGRPPPPIKESPTV